jgi:peptidoglycan/LPS O-acetylase OafA/YrhL
VTQILPGTPQPDGAAGAPDLESPTATGTPARAAPRLAGLDGIRGIAALFVVLHHCWLRAFPGFPYTPTPLWTGWLAFGHLAVVVFIVLSGFSLALGPARRNWQLGSIRRFLHRRAWRILPPYWAALVFSLLMAWIVVPQPGEGTPTGKSVVIFGLLLQDVFGSPSPNGAFWSIAIEAQLYLALPLLLLVRRRAGAAVVLLVVTVPGVVITVLAPWSPVVAMFLRFVPEMAVLFTIGVVAARAVVQEPERCSGRLPWGCRVGLAALPPLLLLLVCDRAVIVANYFWVDIIVGPSVALLLVGLATGRLPLLTRVLDIRPVRAIGASSYSLYLVHAPIVVAVGLVVARVVPHGVPMLVVLFATAVPLSICFAWWFARVFELPFQRHRSWSALKAARRS